MYVYVHCANGFQFNSHRDQVHVILVKAYWLHTTCNLLFFLFFESFHSFVFRFTAWVLGLQFRFRVRLMLRVKFRGYV